MCFYNEYDPDILDDIDEDYSKATHLWQPLESLLTVYIDLIERGKIVALHKSVRPAYPRWRENILQGGNLMATTMEQREELPQDPSVPKRLENTRNPWAIVAYTEEDLDLALHRWENLIQAIEDRIPGARSEVPHSTGIFPVEVLRTAGLEEERFAYKFFTRAWKPCFKYIAPGLRLPTEAEFLASRHSFEDIREDLGTTPISILRGDHGMTASNPWVCEQQPSRIPWGLYLDKTQVVALCPFEDGCQLVLPYKIAGPVRRKRWNGEWENSNTSLLQISQNPFIIEHRSQLALFLGYFAKAVVDDLWTINKEGVANNVDWYKMAESDDEDVRKQFIVPVGPDRQWC